MKQLMKIFQMAWKFKRETKHNIRVVFFFFLFLNLLIGWQLSICICCRSFSSLLDNYQLLCFWRLALSIAVEVVPRPFFPDIAPSRMLTTNSLCLIVCPIPDWPLFFKIFKSNLYTFILKNFIIRYSICPFYF